MTGALARTLAVVDIRGLLSADAGRAAALGVPAAGILVWWAAAEGGYPPGTWYPGALAFLALAFAAVPSARTAGASRSVVGALACLAGFTAWSFASITWAQARGDAWDGGNRTLLYLTIAALFALVPWRAATAATLAAAISAAVAMLGVVALLRAGFGPVGAALDEGRLAGPTGYANGTAGLFFIAFWPALVLACARPTPRWARGALLATAGVLAHLVVLAQSRGSLVAGIVALGAVVALGRERRRLAVGGLLVFGATLASLPALLAVYGAGPADAQGALRVELVALAATVVVLGIAGARMGDHPPGHRRSRAGRRIGLAVAIAAAALAAALFAGGSRLSEGVSSGRFDLWRVSARQLAHHPVGGAGADNFAHDQARWRRGLEEPLHPHGVVLRTLGQTGVVGGLLFAGFVTLGFAGAAGAARRRSTAHDELGAAVAAAGAVAFACWLGHASVDWLWELPAVTGLAFAFLGLSLSMDSVQRAAAPRRRLAIVGGLGALAAVAAATYALPGLAAHRIETAVQVAERDPALAARRLDDARRLNPLSARADIIAGVLAARAGDAGRARAAFSRAIERDGGDWYPRLRLGLIDAEAGRPAAARGQLRAAQALNPREPTIATALRRAAAGGAPARSPAARIEHEAIPGPLGRHSIDCRPVLGLAAACRAEGR